MLSRLEVAAKRRPSGTRAEYFRSLFSHSTPNQRSRVKKSRGRAEIQAKEKPLFPGAFLNNILETQATLRINRSRNSSGIRSCNTRAWAIATSAI